MSNQQARTVFVLLPNDALKVVYYNSRNSRPIRRVLFIIIHETVALYEGFYSKGYEHLLQCDTGVIR